MTTSHIQRPVFVERRRDAFINRLSQLDLTVYGRATSLETARIKQAQARAVAHTFYKDFTE